LRQGDGSRRIDTPLFHPSALAGGGICRLSLPTRFKYRNDERLQGIAYHLLMFLEVGVPLLAAIFLKSTLLLLR
jgi:hypothetical protein